MSKELVILAQIAVGCAMIVGGIRVRMGGLRGRVLRYRNFWLPWFMRNGMFVLIPAGLAFVSFGVVEVVFEYLPSPARYLVATSGLVIGFVALSVALWWAYTLPDRVKPQWLRDEEARTGKPTDPDRLGSALDRVSAVFLFGSGLLVLVVAVVSGAAYLLSLVLS